MIEDADGVSPKYLMGTNYAWSIVDFGSERLCIAGVIDISQADHDTLSAQSDVRALPANLDAMLTSGAVTSISSFLEARNVPAGWVNTSRTYRQTLRVLIGIFQFVQRWKGISVRGGDGIKSPFTEGLNLDTTYSQIPLKGQQKLQECFTSLDVDFSMLTAGSTIREVLFEFGKQMALRPCVVGGEQI